ncbi:MAG: DMT family protein [Sedimentisphaerales bacterium]|nr:DMT family protein [Sedimentisphaerales bacterium]
MAKPHSWSIAFFEYMLQVPANRIGHTAFSVAHLKILQEVITLLVFVPFSVWYLKESFRTDFIWAGLCIIAAVYFIFRNG